MSWTGPTELRSRLQRLWDRGELLASLVTGEPLFPRRLTLTVPTSAEMTHRFDEVRAWVGELRGMKYCRVEMREFRHRLLGVNAVPQELWIDRVEDALALLGKQRGAARFVALVAMTRCSEPRLLSWLARRPLRALELAGEWERLLEIVSWMELHPASGLYLRQVDIPGVHTKFIETHRGVLGELLETVLPPEAIVPGATGVSRFAQRYGFRDKPVLIRFRPLDPDCSPLAGIGSGDITQALPGIHHRERDQLSHLSAGEGEPGHLRRRLRFRDAAGDPLAEAVPYPLLGGYRHPRLCHPQPAPELFRPGGVISHGSRHPVGL